MLYDAHNQPIQSTLADEQEANDIKDIPSQNFPPPTPKPDWFDAAVNKIGGYADPGTNKIPKYRVVWGMDPNITQFAMGKMRMKYVSIVDTYETLKGYNIINTRKKKNNKFFLPPIEAHKRYLDPNTGQMTRGGLGILVSPVITTEEREIGIPLWIMEQWVPPEAFGDAVGWNNERYLVNPMDSTDYIDALGEYPEKGMYIHWFDLLDYDEEGRTIYRDLDEGAIEILRANHVMNIARREKLKFTTPESARKERSDKIDAEWEKWDKEMTNEMLDIKKHKVSV